MATKHKKNKVGRPSEKKVYPVIPFGPQSIELSFAYLKKHGGFCIPHLGVIVIRKVSSRKLFHNFSGKTIIIPAHKKIHLIPNENVWKTLSSK